MVPSIRVRRPSGESDVAFVNTANVSSIALDEAQMHGSGVAGPLGNDEVHHEEMENGFDRMNGSVDIPRARKMSPREEKMKWWRVYAMHFLFMWNSRTFEYVSVRKDLLDMKIIY